VCVCVCVKILSYITNAPTCFAVSAATLANAVSKLPGHGAETPKHAGAFVTKYNLIFNMHLFVQIISKFDFFKMSHPRCVYINNRCGYQSITQQYLKKICLIKDEVNYMFRPNVAIIRFTPESIVVLLYRIGMDMSRW